MSLSERWFSADSTYVAATVDDDVDADRTAWEIDTLYDLAGLSIDRRRLFAHRCEVSRARSATRAAIDEAGRRYRAARSGTDDGRFPSPPAAHAPIAEWRSATADSLRSMRATLGASSEEYASVVRSFVHMHCNRRLPHHANYWEALCNSMLRRHYDAMLR